MNTCSLNVSVIIEICSASEYSSITDFKWYGDVLCTLALNSVDNNFSAKLISSELFKLCQLFPNSIRCLLECIKKLIHCDNDLIRSTATYLVGKFDDLNSEKQELYTTNRVCPELPYALLKDFVHSATIDIERIENLLARFELIEKISTDQVNCLQTSERCAELCSLPKYENALWEQELTKVFSLYDDYSGNDVSILEVPEELLDIVDVQPQQTEIRVNRNASFKSNSKDQEEITPITYQGKFQFFNNNELKLWFETHQKGNILIVHIQSLKISSDKFPRDVRLSACPSAEWKDQLFILYKKVKRITKSHISLYYRITGVSSPQKLAVDLFWKSTSTSLSEKYTTINIAVNVSSFLLPFSSSAFQSGTTGLTCSSIPYTDKKVIDVILKAIPALHINSNSLNEASSQTLFKHKVKVRWTNNEISIESEEADFGTSLTDEIRSIILQI
ncbi:hypothetical protein GJ496_011230 [Pomphorhynchus laevis]|nr:hypothetical protein GJ496_011230 [Pomphorhynchus laevis]